ncbi:unnamed protein product [Durusdinium trenchii]|uniref:histidinol-phosphate transaminase n=1 Tax=Durusdinium trenchii TaxID=1381693 RepID=A0ABP0HNJ9_9DINO
MAIVVAEVLMTQTDFGSFASDPSLQCGLAEFARAAVRPHPLVLFVNGSDQGIDLVVRCCCPFGSEVWRERAKRALAGEAAEVIIPSPTFAMFEQAAESEGLVIRRPNFTKEGGFPLAEVLEMVNSKTALVVLSNPNNPTGTEIPREAIIQVLETVKCAVLVDECYFEFMDPKSTVVGEVDRFPNLFVSRTFSKTWGIPSLRLGYLVSTKPNVDALTCVRGPYDINQIAVVGITAALKQRQYVFEYVREVMEPGPRNRHMSVSVSQMRL